MQVSHMFIRSGQGNIKAFAKIKSEEGFIMDGFRVIEGSKGLFVGWPTKEVVKNGEKEYYPVVTTDEDQEDNPFRKSVNEMVLTRYMEEMSSRGVTVNIPSNNWASKGKDKVVNIRQAAKPTEVPDDQVVIAMDDDWG